MENIRRSKYKKYLSIDLDTKHLEFKKNHYTVIKKYFEHLGFVHLKDTNYRIDIPLGNKETTRIGNMFAKTYPEIACCLKKLDWTSFMEENNFSDAVRITKRANKIIKLRYEENKNDNGGRGR
jgi:sugar phosphate isomerase/epimerase